MSRYLLGGLLGAIAFITAYNSGLPDQVRASLRGLLAEHTRAFAQAADLPPVERAGRFVQRQGRTAPAETTRINPATIPTQVDGVPGQQPTTIVQQPTITPGGFAPAQTPTVTPAQTNLDSIPALW